MKSPKNKFDTAANSLSLTLQTGVVLYLALAWRSIPDRIPGHYDASGAVNRWACKGELLIPLLFGWILFLVITAAAHAPQTWNTGVRIMAENRDRVYAVLQNMLSTMKLLIAVFSAFLTVNMARALPLPAWFLPVFLGSLFGSILFFVVKLYRSK
jgi:uncharacterized membrane protein